MKSDGRTSKNIAIYHDMRVHENFEQCASRLFELVRDSERRWPGAHRILYLDVQGHRNIAGGFDRDALEIMKEYLLTFLMPFLTAAYTPLVCFKNPNMQVNSLPDVLEIADPTPTKTPRDESPVGRKSRPTLLAIAGYLGLEEPICMICWDSPVERAHAQPLALSGSNDIRNFALLCARHHRMAPDVADSNAFWAWMDWMLEIEGFHSSRLRPEGVIDEGDFGGVVDRQLRELYGWSEEELSRVSWRELMPRQYRILTESTSTHFGVKRKASTYAWAIDQALRELSGS